MNSGNKISFLFDNRRIKSAQGFSLVEVLVGASIFLIVSVSVYQGYLSIYHAASGARYKLDAAALGNEQLEIVRNLPYASVGVVGSIPVGLIPHSQTIVRDAASFSVTATVRNVDDPFDGTLGGTPNDLSPADHKLVQIDIDCAGCKNFTPVSFSTIVSPKNLETASANGALFIKVFDGNGVAVQNANVHVVNASSTITIDDVTDAMGNLELVDVPPGNTAYKINVSKPGYTTDQTYPSSAGNPNPSHPNATVLLQQVTQTSFSIDKVSTLAISTVSPTCSAIGGISFSYGGSKLIGTSPDIAKHSVAATTDGSGNYSDTSTEWDTYAFAMATSSYELLGMNPVNPVTIAPNAAQNVQMIVHSKTPQSVLVSVVDLGTGLPISGATVEMTGPGSYDETQATGEGYISQTDWSGGSGQQDIGNAAMYSSSDGNTDASSPAGDIRLAFRVGQFQAAGQLTSSTFDIGSSSNYGEILWNPTDEPVATGPDSVKFQVATNNDDATWNFSGPDGSAATYYTTANQAIAASNDGHRYFRYRAYLSTADVTTTPNISDVAFTFTTACTPPGQVVFDKLSPGTYTITVNKAGYQQKVTPQNVGNAWSSVMIQMNP